MFFGLVAGVALVGVVGGVLSTRGTAVAPAPVAIPTSSYPGTATPAGRSAESVAAGPSAPVRSKVPTATLTPVFDREASLDQPRYVNGRYAFACTLPKGWSQQESVNGDGVTARSGPDTVSCWGERNVDAATLPGLHQGLKQELLADGWTITFESAGSVSSRLSGTRDGRVVYRFTLVAPGVLRSVAWEYGEDRIAELDSAVTRSVVEFAAGEASGMVG